MPEYVSFTQLQLHIQDVCITYGWNSKTVPDKGHQDITQNPTCVTITRLIFMNKKTIGFHAYQANHLEQWAENRYVAGIIIIKSPCSSTKESDYKPLSCDSKANYM